MIDTSKHHRVIYSWKVEKKVGVTIWDDEHAKGPSYGPFSMSMCHWGFCCISRVNFPLYKVDKPFIPRWSHSSVENSRLVPSLKLTVHTWKIDDWKTSPSFWGSAYVQWRAVSWPVSFRDCRCVYIITVYCWALVLYDTWYSFPWSRSTHHGATVATSPAPPAVPNRPPPRPPAALASAGTHEVAQPAGATGDALVVKFWCHKSLKKPSTENSSPKISRIECFDSFFWGDTTTTKRCQKKKHHLDKFGVKGRWHRKSKQKPPKTRIG